MQLSSLLVLTAAPLALATDNMTNSTDDGLNAGAVAGIVIGSVAGVALIGAAVWYFFLKDGAMYGSRGGGGAMTSAAVGSNAAGNHLPMVALRLANDDDL